MNDSNNIPRQLQDLKARAEITSKAVKSFYPSFESDWLAALLISRLRLGPAKAASLGFLLVVLFYGLSFGLHLMTGKDVAGLGIKNVHLDIIYDIFIIPIVYGFYVWINARPQKLFLELHFTDSNLNSAKFLEYTNRVFFRHIHNRLWPMLGLLTAAIFAILIEYISFTELRFVWGTEEASFALFRIFKVPILWGIAYYMLVVTFLKQLVVVVSIHNLLRRDCFSAHTIKDRVQATQLIANYCSEFSYYIGACGLGYVMLLSRSIAFGYFMADIIVNLTLIVFILVSLFFFSFPLQSFLIKSIKDYRSLFQTELAPPFFGIPARALATILLSIASPILFYNIVI